MVRVSTLFEHRDLFRSLPEVRPDLPQPRIEVTRRVKHQTTLIGDRTCIVWDVIPVGLDGSRLDYVECESLAEMYRSVCAFKDQLGWPVVRLRCVAQTQLIYEKEVANG